MKKALSRIRNLASKCFYYLEKFWEINLKILDLKFLKREMKLVIPTIYGPKWILFNWSKRAFRLKSYSVLSFVGVLAFCIGSVFLINQIPKLGKYIDDFEYNNRAYVVSSNFIENQENVNLDEYIAIKLSKNLNPELLKSKLEKDSKLELEYLGFEEELGYKFIKKDGWHSDSEYKIKLDDSELIKYGFTTKFRTVNSPQVVLTNISDEVITDHMFIFSFNDNYFDKKNPDYAKDLIEFNPTLKGNINIMSPSTIRFEPEGSLIPDTEYEVRIKAGEIENIYGLKMKDDFTSKFRVISKNTQQEILNTDKNAIYINTAYTSVRQNTQDSIIVVLGQDVSRSSFEQNISLKQDENNIAFSITWDQKTYEELQGDQEFYAYNVKSDYVFNIATLTPKVNWKASNSYKLQVSRYLSLINGKQLDNDYSKSFSPINPLKVEQTPIENGEFDISSNYYWMYLRFNNPLIIEKEKLKEYVKIYDISKPSNELDITVDAYYTNISLRADLKDSKQYRLWLSPDIQDVYGYNLNVAYELTFTTINPEQNEPMLNIFGSDVAFADNTGDHKILLESRKLNDILIEVVSISPMEYIEMFEMDWQQQRDKRFEFRNVVKNWTKKFEEFDKNTQISNNVLQFQYNLEGLEDGIYIIRAHKDHYRDSRVLILSKKAVVLKVSSEQNQALAWIVDTKTGEGLSGVDLELYSNKNITKSKTNKDGIAIFDNTKKDLGYSQDFIYSKNGDVFSYSGFDSELSNSYYGNYYSYYQEPNPLINFVYIDKPVYRAGQTMKYKVFARKKQGNNIVTNQDELNFEIKDANNTVIHSQVFTPNEFGTFDDEVKLSDNLLNGEYWIYLNSISSTSFRIEDYKVYNYRFDAKLKQNRIYKSEDLIELSIDANYYFGEPLSDADVEVSLFVRDLEVYNLDNEYIKNFGYYNFPNYWDLQQNYNYDSYNSTKLKTVKAKTNSQGKVEISIPYSIPTDKAYLVPKLMSIEVKMIDSLGQEEYKTIYTNISPKDGLIGISSVRGNVQQGGNFLVKAIYLDDRLEPKKAENLVFDLYKVEERQIKKRRIDGVYFWQTYYDKTLESSQSITTDKNGLANLEIKSETDGRYEVIVRLEKNANVFHKQNLNSYGYDSYYYDWWSYDPSSQIKLNTDKDSYQVNDEIKIVPELPDYNFVGLATVEKAGILSYEIVRNNDLKQIKQKVSQDMMPNAYFSLFTISPRDFGNEFLRYHIGFTDINVDLKDRYLKMDLKTDKDSYSPQETVKLTLETKDQQAKSADVEYLVAVVDKAVLDVSKIEHNEALSDRMIAQFWKFWPLGVSTSSNLTIYENKIIAEKKWGNKGGSGDGGGGGSSLELQKEDIRKEFKDVAYWIGSKHSSDGKFETEFRVPDNLTSWEIVAIAISKDTKIQAVTREITVSKEVSIISGLPAYLTKGDEIELIYNASFADNFRDNNQNVPLTVQLEVNEGEINCRGNFVKKCTIEKTLNEFPCSFDYKAQDSGMETFTFAIGQDDNIFDAEERNVRVDPDFQEINILDFGNTKTDTEFEYNFEKGHEIGEKEVRITLSDNMVGDLSEFEDYYANYRNLCSEQVSSRILGLLPFKDENENSDIINEMINYLYTLQNNDGGFGIWVNDKSLDYNSVYVYFALNQALDNGFDVNSEVLEKTKKHIEQRAKHITNMYDKTFIWWVLSENDIYDISSVNNYYDVSLKDNNSLLTRAYLAYTYQNYLNSNKISILEKPEIRKRISRLVEYINSRRRNIQDRAYWSEERVLGSYYYVNDIQTNAFILELMMKLNKEEKTLIPVINYLKNELALKKIGSTHSRYFVYRALAIAKDKYSMNLEKAKLRVMVNGEEISTIEKDSDKLIYTTKIANDVDKVVIKIEDLNDSLFYFRNEVKYKLHYKDVKVQENKISMFSDYFTLDNKYIDLTNPNDSFQRNTIYKIKTTIVVREDLNQSEIHIPVPSGFQAINFNLANMSSNLEERFKAENRYGAFVNMIINDEEVVLYTGDNYYNSHLKQGIYEINYYVRANYRGEFYVPGVWMQEMYLPSRYIYQDRQNIKVN